MAENQIRVFEHAYYIGNYMSGILYGLQLFLYFLTIRKLRKRKAGTSQNKLFCATYSTIALVLLTIDISCNAVWGESMWIEARELPGGVLQFFATQTSVWYQTMGSASVVALIFMGDAFLLCRLFVFWGHNWLVMTIPILVYVAAFALAIIQLVVAGKPDGNFFGDKSINFGTPYYTITIGLNIVLTTLIYVRLRRLTGALNRMAEAEAQKSYNKLPAVLIESAALYSLIGLTFLVSYAVGSQTSVAFGQVWAKLTCICPQMIILGIAGGRAWDRQTIAVATESMLIDGTPEPSTNNEVIDVGAAENGDGSRK